MKLSRNDIFDLNTSTGTYIKPYQETASTTANLLAYGVSTLTYTTAAQSYTLAAPIVGVEKTLILNSTLVSDSTAVNLSVYTGSTAIFISNNSTTVTNNLYINIQPPYAAVKLIGLSTAKWGIISTYGAVQLSTAGTYST